MDTENLVGQQNQERQIHVENGFNHRVIARLSITVLVLGTVLFLVGASTLVISLTAKCQYRDYNDYYSRPTTTPPPFVTCSYPRTMSSPGLWCGAIFIASGIIGIFAARRRTICFIISFMTMTVVSNWIALCGVVISVGSHFDKKYDQINNYHIVLHILDSIISLFCLAVFIIQWIQFGCACSAACCNGKKGYPKMKRSMLYGGYRPLSAPSMQSFPANSSTPSQIPPTTSSVGSEAIYLVQGQKVIGVLPQNLQQYMLNVGNTTLGQLQPSPNDVSS